MERTGDGELLRKYALDNDQRAFADLVARHIDWVYSCALRMTYGDAPLAQDVTQGVFLALAQKGRRLASHPNVAAWLFQATRFAAATARRSELRRKTHEARAMQQAAVQSSTFDRYWEQIRDRLEDAV